MANTTAQHKALYEALTEAGHDVAIWADDPTLLRDYARAINFTHTANDRDEADSCERGTPGCAVHHYSDSNCETW